jgi:hypothetical protein
MLADDYPEWIEIVRSMHRQEKLIADVCHAGGSLCSAGNLSKGPARDRIPFHHSRSDPRGRALGGSPRDRRRIPGHLAISRRPSGVLPRSDQKGRWWPLRWPGWGVRNAGRLTRRPAYLIPALTLRQTRQGAALPTRRGPRCRSGSIPKSDCKAMKAVRQSEGG